MQLDAVFIAEQARLARARHQDRFTPQTLDQAVQSRDGAEQAELDFPGAVLVSGFLSSADRYWQAGYQTRVAQLRDHEQTTLGLEPHQWRRRWEQITVPADGAQLRSRARNLPAPDYSLGLPLDLTERLIAIYPPRPFDLDTHPVEVTVSRHPALSFSAYLGPVTITTGTDMEDLIHQLATASTTGLLEVTLPQPDDAMEFTCDRGHRVVRSEAGGHRVWCDG